MYIQTDIPTGMAIHVADLLFFHHCDSSGISNFQTANVLLLQGRRARRMYEAEDHVHYMSTSTHTSSTNNERGNVTVVVTVDNNGSGIR